MQLTMEREVEQLRSLVEDLFMRIESLEDRVNVLESESAAKPTGPEPLLTCVQCHTEYKESENAEGHCKYHSGTLRYGGWKATYTCCNKSAGDREKAMSLPGCGKGKHRSKHHTDYVYSHYYFHMMDLSNEAKEMWLEMDVRDLVTDSCEWAEIGLSREDRVFVLVGNTRVQPVVYVELSMAELKQCKKPVNVLFEKKDPAGWCLRAELCASGPIANAISVSLKAASDKSLRVKRLQLVLCGDCFKPGSVDTLFDTAPSVATGEHAVQEELREGPVLEPGEDLSTNRKTDYPTLTNDDMFALELQQADSVVVNSSYRTQSGKWNNLFVVNIKLNNGLPGSLSIIEVVGEYLNKGGEWVHCDDVWVKPSEGERFLETVDFLVGGAAPLSMTIQLAIGIDGPEPDSWMARKRAHHSLPQPLHLRLTCVDELGRTASVRVEQGNPPLSLPTSESRMKSWNKGNPLLFYIFADDIDTFKRSDAAIYYDDNGMMVFRPAPNDQGSQLFFLRDNLLQKAAYQAQNSSLTEVELTSLKKENQGSTVRVFALGDQGATYGVRVVVTTPTSKADGVYILPKDDFSVATLSLNSSEVTVNNSFDVNWMVPRASKNDQIELYSQFGSKAVSRSYNKQALAQGGCEMKAPLSPGLYDVRYYPSWLRGSYTGLRHDVCVASAPLTVRSA